MCDQCAMIHEVKSGNLLKAGKCDAHLDGRTTHVFIIGTVTARSEKSGISVGRAVDRDTQGRRNGKSLEPQQRVCWGLAS